MKSRFGAVLLLLLYAWLELSTLAITSPTADESLHIMRGYIFVTRGDDRYRMRGPVLSNALTGLMLAALEPPIDFPPPEDPIWEHVALGDDPDPYLFGPDVPTLRIFFLARLPIIAVSWLLGALIFRWARERAGGWAAVGVLTLYVFDPNLLAHSRLVTTDAIAAATLLLGAYVIDKALRQPGWRTLIWAGMAFGLAMAAKFSATALLPAFAAVAFVWWWPQRADHRAWRKYLALGAGIAAMGGLTVWAIYGFKVAALRPGELPLPAPSYWGEWEVMTSYLKDPFPSYLFGQISARGWWYYYPVTFLAKTPLPVLILLALAIVITIRRRAWRADLPVFLAATLYFGSLLTSPHDLGYRYLLPILPAACVYSTNVFQAAAAKRGTRLVVIGLIGWQIIGLVRIYPYYLTYFNEVIGGPDRGRYILSDSNLDWGQDLIGLKHYLDQQPMAEPIKLSYGGITRASLYGLKTQALPPVYASMSDQGAWWLYTYYPFDPPPGRYAIGVMNLMGNPLLPASTYAYFRDRTPDTIIGNSIYLYAIAPRGEMVNLSLAGLQIDQIDPQTYQGLATNDVRPRWFEATRSIIAAPDRARVAIADDQPIAPEFAPLFDGLQPEVRATTLDDQRAYAVYSADFAARLEAAAAAAKQMAGPLALPVRFGESADLIGYDAKRAGDQLTLTTYWRAGDRIQAPLQLFAHALGADGSLVAQEDRLDVPAYGWRSGDRFAQINRLTLPDPAATVAVAVGFYEPDSGARVPVLADGARYDDRLWLAEVAAP
ncbi:MAG: glycosyltransferase family 39 protein [Chloroflexi bacterium]|nr:glycosyltransferase family 39 protein [Chloroflexota bacterium]